jgi:hypothetical protein
VLRVDGADVDTKQIPHTIAFLITFDETFDVGMDTRSGVNDADYHVPFAFTGKINKITVKPGPEQFTEEDRQPGGSGNWVRALLSLSRVIDAINVQIGKWCAWAILLAVVISAGNGLDIELVLSAESIICEF